MDKIIPDNEFVPDKPLTPQSNESGFIPDSDFKSDEESLQLKYGTPGQQAIAGVEGLAKGLAGPLATAGETKLLGIAPEDIAGRAEANPITHYGSEAAGLIGGSVIPGVGEATQAGVLGRVGSAVSEGLGLSGAVGTAARFGVENALYTIGDETSKAILGNPASIQTAAAHVGLSGLLGAGLGAGLGKVGELWQSKVGSEADQFVQDFSSRLKSHSEGAIPTVEALHEELSNEFSAVEAAKNDLRGVEGLKSHEMAQVLPKTLSPNMAQQGNEIVQEVEGILAKARQEPGIYRGSRLPALRDYGSRLAESLDSPELTPQKIFVALDDFKKGLGSLKKWDISMGETEKPAAGLIGDLYHKVRVGLEDSSVWGKAGSRQEAINKLWTEHIPASKDFARTFTEKLAGESQVSPSKVSNLLNGLGKSNAEIKLDKLSNYLEANDRLYKELDKIHSNLGIDNPYKRPSLSTVRAISSGLTPGMKAADFLHEQAANAAAEVVGGGAGAIVGHMSGIPGGGYLGSLFGHYALKPFLKTIMPSIIRPLLKVGPSGAGLKAAIEGVSAIAKGEALLNDSAKALFEVGSSKAISDLVPDKGQMDKLMKSIHGLQENPESISNSGGKLSHYLPEHATVLSATAQAAVNYLDSQKPSEVQAGVLDRKMAPSPDQLNNYHTALEIAQSPLMVLSHIKNGTLLPEHIEHLKNLYPALFPSIVSAVTNSMLNHLSNGGHVPFKMRQGLGQLIGQPVDSTFSQASMAAAQQTFVPPQRPQDAPSPKKGASKLGMSAKLAMTPSDARQRALNKT